MPDETDAALPFVESLDRTTATKKLKRGARLNWRSAFFANVESSRRRRSGRDGARLIVGIIVTLLVAVAFRSGTSVDNWWVQVAVPPPTGLSWFLTGLFLVGTFGVAALLILLAFFGHRRYLVIDLALGFGAGLSFSYLFQFLFGVSAGRPNESALSSVNVGFPMPVVAAVIALGIVGRPYLARQVRQFTFVAIASGTLGALATGRALPLAIAGSVVVGWSAASTVRLVRGNAWSTTSYASIIEALATLGVELVPSELSESEVNNQVEQWGVERVAAMGVDGQNYRISAYGRDTRDAELLSSLWRLVTTRDSGVTPFIGRQQQAEHEALAILNVHDVSAGASPAFVGLTSTLGTGDVLVVSRFNPGRSLANTDNEVSHEQISAFVSLIHRLQSQRIALNSIDRSSLRISETGEALIDETLYSNINASDGALNRDVASLLTLVALVRSVDEAVSMVGEVFGKSAVADALPYLQRPALAMGLRNEVKAHATLLKDLGAAGATYAEVEQPKLAPLKRVSGTTIVLTLGTLIGGWALLGVFINVAASISTLRGADWAWVGAVAVISQLTYGAIAMSDLGSITGTLPIGRLVALEVSNTFSGLAAGTVAVMAARVRFFQRQGYDTTIALSSGAITSMASWIVKGALFLIALPFAWSSFDFGSLFQSGQSSHQKFVNFVLLVILAVGVAGALIAAIPKWRRVLRDKMAPKYQEVRAQLASLAAQPKKLVEVFGGNTAAQLIVALALGASLHAFNTGLPLSALIVVLTLGSVLGGMSPVPGGMGVVEAGMILGLTAAGIDEPVAVSAVFVQRLWTAYLPPVWGYFTLLWLRRRDYL